MGYSTDFSGHLTLSKPLTEEQNDYYDRFTAMRHMKRNNDLLRQEFKGEFGLDGEYGIEGEYFVGDEHMYHPSVIDVNRPAATQPGLWCQWVVNGMDTLEWDEGEKFYEYEHWLEYVIKHFFSKWDIQLNGTIKWQGEEMDDRGKIIVVDNVITIVELE